VNQDELAADLAERAEKIRTEMGGVERIARIHERGGHTIRERIDALVDPGSFRELGRFARSADPADRENTPGDGKIGGHARLDGRPVVVFGDDITVRQGSSSLVSMRKEDRLVDHALLHGTPIVLSAVLVALLGGALVAVQQAFNGRVNSSVGQPLATAWTSFLAGTLGLGIGVATLALVADTGMHPPSDGPWWMYAGGALGVCFVATTAWAVPRYGVLTVALIVIAGQLMMALALDLLAPIGSAHVTLWLTLGVVLTFVAVGTGAWTRSRR